MWQLAIVLVMIAAGCQRVSLEVGSGVALPSNIRAGDYVGPEECGRCHGEKYKLWSGNLHRAMNRAASEVEAVAGDFSGASLSYAGGGAIFDRRDGVPHMTLRSAGGEQREFRVTRTIGARYIQEYVGVEVSPSPSDVEVRLPFGYWFREKRWYHQQYFDSWFGAEYSEGDRPTIDAFAVDRTPWAARCAWCHNTYPFDLRVSRAQSAKPAGFGPETFYRLAEAPTVTGNRLPTESLVTIGISCESCHFGGREHSAGLPIRFGPVSPDLELRDRVRAPTGDRSDPATINLICAQCHSAPSPSWPSGAAMRNSREALDMEGGGCATAIRCTDCHDPHPRGAAAGSPPNADHIEACLSCHAEFATDEAAERHSGHARSDATCLDCHMPRIVQGFSGPLRSHRISSPSAAQVLLGEEPDACGLCHLDKSSEFLAFDLSVRWGQVGMDGTREKDLRSPIGERWLRSSKPIVSVTAAAAYGLAPTVDGRIARILVERTREPIAYYRMRYFFALSEALGRRPGVTELDPSAPPRVRAAQVVDFLAGFR